MPTALFSTLRDLGSSQRSSLQSDRAGSQVWTVLGLIYRARRMQQWGAPWGQGCLLPRKAPPSPCPCRLTYGQTEPPAQGLVDSLGLKNLENSPGVQVSCGCNSHFQLSFLRVAPNYLRALSAWRFGPNSNYSCGWRVSGKWYRETNFWGVFQHIPPSFTTPEDILPSSSRWLGNLIYRWESAAALRTHPVTTTWNLCRRTAKPSFTLCRPANP